MVISSINCDAGAIGVGDAGVPTGLVLVVKALNSADEKAVNGFTGPDSSSGVIQMIVRPEKIAEGGMSRENFSSHDI